MTMIHATGMKNGEMLEVYFSRIKNTETYTFNHRYNVTLEAEIKDELRKRHPFAGTYYPEENSELNVLNVLQHYFFDSRPEIETQGDFEEMPSEPGVIY